MPTEGETNFFFRTFYFPLDICPFMYHNIKQSNPSHTMGDRRTESEGSQIVLLSLLSGLMLGGNYEAQRCFALY
jgi:uncharacterized protein (UPF0262 family)